MAVVIAKVQNGVKITRASSVSYIQGPVFIETNNTNVELIGHGFHIKLTKAEITTIDGVAPSATLATFVGQLAAVFPGPAIV